MQRRDSAEYDADIRALLGSSHYDDDDDDETCFLQGDADRRANECLEELEGGYLPVDPRVWRTLSFRTASRIQHYAGSNVLRSQEIVPAWLPHAWDAAHWVLRLWGDQRRLKALEVKLNMSSSDLSWFHSDKFDYDGGLERMACMCAIQRGTDMQHVKWWLERDFGELTVTRTVVAECVNELDTFQVVQSIASVRCVNTLCINKLNTLPSFQALDAAVSSNPELHALHCTLINVPSCFYLTLQRLTSLQSLSIKCSTYFNLDVLKMFPNLHQLRVDTVSRTGECSGVESLCHCPKLRCLRFHGVKLAYRPLQAILNLPALQTFELNHSGGAMLMHLVTPSTGNHLQRVSLSHCDILPNFVELSNYVNLRDVDLSSTQASNECIEKLAECPLLEKVNLFGCVHVNNISPLERCKFLKEVNFGGTAIESFTAYCNGTWEALESIDMRDCSDLRDVSPLAHFPALRSIRISDAIITTLGEIGKDNFPALKCIDIRGCKELRDISAFFFSPALKSILISSTPIATLGEYQVGMLPALTSIVLEFCFELRDVSMLAYCPALWSIRLSHSPITTMGVYRDGMFPVLELMDMECCPALRDVSALALCSALRIIHLRSISIGMLGGYREGIFPSLKSITLADCHNLRDMSALSGFRGEINH